MKTNTITSKMPLMDSMRGILVSTRKTRKLLMSEIGQIDKTAGS